MRKALILLLLFYSFACLAERSGDFNTEKISTQVKDFKLDSINLTTPLDYYLARTWVRTTGKQKYWADISTSKFDFDKDAIDEDVEDDLRNYILSEHIDCIVSYRDSVASIVTYMDGEDYVLLNYCWIENGRWVNGGQGMADDFNEAQNELFVQLPIHYNNLPRIAQINSIPKDITPFVDFLNDVEFSPEQYVMEMLGSHKLVVNGELHRRKVSWDMLKRLISMPEFPKKVGYVFMELPSWCQPMMDRFMASETLETDIILQIFREEQINGWWDRGEFEFICELWRLNHYLPEGNKIKVVLADYQIPYSKVTNSEEREKEDRNTHMANVVAETIMNSNDTRNNLFIVGCAHAYKSIQPGIASAADGKNPETTAGAQLVNKLGNENVFTIFQHMLSGDNSGNNKRPIRGGVFDKAFELNGNLPVGFTLAGSPFGKEPFDGIYEIKYNISTGNYADNYDGFLFLHPTADEPKAMPLIEIFTDEFVDEMKRRASVMGIESMRWLWFGITAPELTKDYIINVLLQDYKDRMQH